MKEILKKNTVFVIDLVAIIASAVFCAVCMYCMYSPAADFVWFKNVTSMYGVSMYILFLHADCAKSDFQ